MAIVPNPHKTTGVLGWIDDRFPLTKMWKDHISEYYAPKNFNFWYFFGSLAMVVLVNQLLTGIFLTMHYKPSAELAFGSIEYIMRDVPFGNIIRYLHSTGQFHKGGPPTGIFLQVVGDDPLDVPIPGRSFGFSQLKRAQADGDLAALSHHGLRAGRVELMDLLGWHP